MKFTEDLSSNGVRVRDFTVGDVPGVLWSPAGSDRRAPLVLMGHGGGTHKKAPAMTGRASLLVNGCGYHVAVIDAPGHGGRPLSALDERLVPVIQRAMAAGEPVASIVPRYNADIAERAVPEWQSTLDALQELPEIGVDGPVGYFGINMGTAIGIPLLAADSRIAAAVLGQFWPETVTAAARQITVPLLFLLQWDDEHIPRAEGLALFDAFASKEKSLHANAGAHKELPRFESQEAVHFFARHLGGPKS